MRGLLSGVWERMRSVPPLALGHTLDATRTTPLGLACGPNSDRRFTPVVLVVALGSSDSDLSHALGSMAELFTEGKPATLPRVLWVTDSTDFGILRRMGFSFEHILAAEPWQTCTATFSGRYALSWVDYVHQRLELLARDYGAVGTVKVSPEQLASWTATQWQEALLAHRPRSWAQRAKWVKQRVVHVGESLLMRLAER